MNGITRRMLSGGLIAGLSALAVSAHAQARSGAWTRNAPDGDWQMPGRDYSLQRFSPLASVSTSNVANLKAAWTFSTGTLRGHEGNPLVVGNVMFVHTSFPNIVYALDLAKEGAPQIWKYTPKNNPDAIPIACCDLVNRGTAYHPSGKVFINALQGTLVAIDAKTGKELWTAQHPATSGAGSEAVGYKDGATITVVMDGRRRSFRMPMHGEAILDAAGRAGLDLPFSCRAGVCSTCRAKLLSGTAEMEHNVALEEWEVEAGYILCCQARPTSPALEISYDE